MKHLAYIFFCSCFLACSPLKKLADLPLAFKENSGIIYTDGHIWLHNDSGDQPFLYKLNLEGELIRSLKIENAKNIDWEDIAQDKAGNVYIGDFGNNYNARKNLCIYKIPNPDTVVADVVSAEKILFSYPDQLAIPPAANHKHFDLEAMIAFKDSLYLFSKNRTQPNNGWTKCYRLPKDSGTYIATLVDSMEIKPHSFLQSITGAAISPDGKKLALLSMTRLYILHHFKGTNFFQAKVKKVYKLPFTQKEAIDFIDNRSILISDEKSPFGKPHLYLLKLP